MGSRFGPYELRSVLGRGGMGEVYEAYDTVKDRMVAVKLLPAELARNPGFRERFRREAHAAARLQEPHVIPIHDWGQIEGILFIDMRLVVGDDLGTVLGRGPVSPVRAVSIVGQVAAALDAAHAAGLVHRDVKPANILISDSGSDFVYLVDFGIASDARNIHLTTAGTTIGTYAYMAPERFDEGAVTGRSDTYSLACVLYETLTGAKPYNDTSVGALIKAHLTAPAPRPSTVVAGVPAALDAVISRGMAKNPADRYAAAGDFARAAQSAMAGESSASLKRRLTETAVRPTPPTRSWSSTTPPPLETAIGPANPGYVTVPPHWAPPPTSTQSAARTSVPTTVLMTVLVLALLGVGGVVAWLVATRASSSDPAPTAAVAPPTGTADPGSASQAPPAYTTVTTPVLVPLTGDVSGADDQGFLAPGGARCNSTNPAMAIGRTTKSLVVVCLTVVNRTYYQGVRLSDGAGISLDDPVPTTGGGFVATNPGDGTTYRLSQSGLTITNAGRGVNVTEPMIEFAHR